VTEAAHALVAGLHYLKMERWQSLSTDYIRASRIPLGGSVPLKALDSPSERFGEITCVFRCFLPVMVAKFDHAAIETRLLSASGPNSQHITTPSCMTIDKAGKQFCVFRLIDQIAAKNQIEFTWLILYLLPVALEERNRV